jgi:CRP/FNR family cyclic AMP-dependent transcriptional regulator
MGAKPQATFNPQKFLRQVGNGKSTLTAPNKQILFSQGDAADAVFYVQAGKVKLSVVSRQGKEAVVAMLEPGSFFGEGCLAAQLVCMTTATAAEDSISFGHSSASTALPHLICGQIVSRL